MHDHDASEASQDVHRVGIGGARVDDHRLAQVVGECQLGLEDDPLSVAGRPVAVEVEPGLADGHRFRVSQQRFELVEAAALSRSLVGMDSENREDAVVAVGELQRRPAALHGRPDGEDPPHAGLRGASDGGFGILERIEVRMGVDHAGVGSSTRGNSGRAGAISSASSAVCARIRSSDRSPDWPRASRI